MQGEELLTSVFWHCYCFLVTYLALAGMMNLLALLSERMHFLTFDNLMPWEHASQDSSNDVIMMDISKNFGTKISSSNLEFGPNHECVPSWESLSQCFTTSQEARRCPPKAILRGKQMTLGFLPWGKMDLKLGMQSCFGQTPSYN